MLLKTYYAFEIHALNPYLLTLIHKCIQPALVLAIWRLYDVVFGITPTVSITDNLSKYTFFVYGLHVPLLYYATDYLHATFGRSPQSSLWIFVGLPLALCFLAFLLGMLVRRAARPFYLILTGFREG